MTKVFLGGTWNNSTWREEIIPKLKIDYFNPVVEDWTKECQKIEILEKKICFIHLYVITKEMTGVFSIAEAVDSAHSCCVETIFHVIPDGFDKGQLKSLQAVASLIKSRGRVAYINNSLDETINTLNGIGEDLDGKK